MQPNRLLSGGQKSRVALCKCCVDDPHVLVLDEPTNHLDLETVTALGQAIAAFNGAAVFVSHDERFITEASNELWHCDGTGQVVQLFCGFVEYKARVAKGQA